MSKRILVFILLISLVFLFALIRPMNVDEPYYSTCSALALAGLKPYKDFVFHQMPYMLYFYSFTAVHGYYGLIAGRLLSSVFLVLTGLLLLRYMNRPDGNRKLSMLLLLFFFLNAFYLDWMVPIKTYTLSSFMLTASVLSFAKVIESAYPSGESTLLDKKYLFISAVCFSSLIFIRIIFVLNFLLFLFYAVYLINRHFKNDRLKLLSIVVAGILINIMLCLLIIRNNFHEFYLGAIEYNIITNTYHLPIWESLFKHSQFLLTPQNIFLILLIALSGSEYSFFEKFILLNIICFFIVHIPVRMFTEYMSVVTPLLALLAVLRYEKFRNRPFLEKVRENALRKTVVTLYAILFLFSEIHIRFWVKGQEMMLNPVGMYSYTKKINSLEGITILSCWEGYSVFTNKRSLLKENYLSAYILDSAKLKQFGLKPASTYGELIDNKVPDIIVYDESNLYHLEDMLDRIRLNYIEKENFKSIRIFIRKKS